MMRLGELRQAGVRGDLPVLRGNLASLVLEAPLAIDPSGEVARNGAAIYDVRLKTPSGRVFDAGTAYSNVIRTGENAGKTMWTIRIGRQPGIPEGLELLAWPEGEGCWYLTADQPREPARPAAPPTSSAGGADEPIPF